MMMNHRLPVAKTMEAKWRVKRSGMTCTSKPAGVQGVVRPVSCAAHRGAKTRRCSASSSRRRRLSAARSVANPVAQCPIQRRGATARRLGWMPSAVCPWHGRVPSRTSWSAPPGWRRDRKATKLALAARRRRLVARGCLSRRRPPIRVSEARCQSR